VPIAATTYTRSPRQGDYEVGYGRPPVATRFKKGHCANPKGRPKGAKNGRTLLREKLETKVSARDGGRQKRMSKLEIGAIRLANRFAETGDPKLFLLIDKVLQPLPDGSPDSHPVRVDASEELSATNRRILDWYLTAMTQPNGRGEPRPGHSPQTASDDEGDPS